MFGKKKKIKEAEEKARFWEWAEGYIKNVYKACPNCRGEKYTLEATLTLLYGNAINLDEIILKVGCNECDYISLFAPKTSYRERPWSKNLSGS